MDMIDAAAKAIGYAIEKTAQREKFVSALDVFEDFGIINLLRELPIVEPSKIEHVSLTLQETRDKLLEKQKELENILKNYNYSKNNQLFRDAIDSLASLIDIVSKLGLLYQGGTAVFFLEQDMQKKVQERVEALHVKLREVKEKVV